MTSYPHLPIPLAGLPPGERAVLFQLNIPKSAINRLLSLGFTPGVEVTSMQNFGRGPLVVNVRGTRVALGRAEAAGLLVKKVNP
jgi:ferrous iron transport protein A